MKESMSLTTIFQIVILFILLFAAIMALTINNSNAFGMKDQIVNYIELNAGNFLDGDVLEDDLVEIITNNSYRTTGTCPDGYIGYDRTGDRLGEGASKSSICIKEVHVTDEIDNYLVSELGAGMVGTDEFVPGVYYQIIVFYQLDLPVVSQAANFKSKAETKIIYQG